MSALSVEYAASIREIGREAWNALRSDDYPFLSYQYLHALEASWSVCARSGWQPRHLLMRDGQGIAALMPLYEKHHSWGEYVFDWSWAEAYQQHGLSYYPKLLTAIPFTPCEGPRILLRPDLSPDALSTLVCAIQERALSGGFSTWHLLFPDVALQETLDHQPLLKRVGVQFHWHNPGCSDFEEFLQLFTSRKRKNVRKERASVLAQGIGFRWLEGAEISEGDLDQFYAFYQATYLKRGQRGYLTRDFFVRLLREMPDQVLLIQALRGARVVAGAWFLKSQSCLYGRYWGCLEEFQHLHFETCYYQGLDYCLANGLTQFDAGAQGEHKLLRGFAPRYTTSYHWLADERFRPAVEDFLARERLQIEAYAAEAAAVLPYRRDGRSD